MSTMTPLVNYLLATRAVGDPKSQLCRFAGIQTTIPVWPPGMNFVWQITPDFNSYAAIYYYSRFSPDIVAGVFDLDIYNRGVSIQAGQVGELQKAEGINYWIEVTVSHPLISDFTNLSPLNQFWDSFDNYILISSEAEYLRVLNIIQEYGMGQGVVENTRMMIEILARIAKIPNSELQALTGVG